MAANRNVQNFFELRQGLLGMREFADAALGYMNENGLAMGGPPVNGKRVKQVPMERIREEVKRRYKKRRPAITGHAVLSTTPKPPTLPAKNRLIQQRQATASVLAQFDTVEPRQVGSRILGVLVRRGYIKKKGDGYVRTAKEFIVARHAAPTKAAETAPTNGHSTSVAPTSRITMAEASGLLKLTENGVRSLVERKTLKGYWEPRVRRGFTKPQRTLVVERDDVTQLAAQRAAN